MSTTADFVWVYSYSKKVTILAPKCYLRNGAYFGQKNYISEVPSDRWSSWNMTLVSVWEVSLQNLNGSAGLSVKKHGYVTVYICSKSRTSLAVHKSRDQNVIRYFSHMISNLV